MNETLNRIFKLKENSTTVRTEIGAGVTSFFAMAYIIFVNPIILSAAGMDMEGVMAATCLAAAVGSVLCGFLSNRPFALASGMGLNSFFAYTLCSSEAYGYTWQQGLALTFLAGLLFLVITLTPLRGRVIRGIPDNLKHAISAGMGLFIALIGLLNGGLIVMTAGFPALGDLKSPQALTAAAGIFITAVLIILKVKAPLLIGMAVTVLISLVTGQTAAPDGIAAMPAALGNVFMKMDFTGLIRGAVPAVTLPALLFSMAFVDMFDTVGYLIGATAQQASSKEDAAARFQDPAVGRVLIADAGATVLGAVCGTSTVTTFAESAAGISAGGKTGLTPVSTAVCFLAAMFFTPLTGVMSAAATAPALVIVGLYMFTDIRNVDFSSMDEAIPAFVTILMMPLTYSITTGMGAGFVTWVICALAARKTEKLNAVVLVMAAVFLVYFIIG